MTSSCSICSKTFTRSANMYRHVATIHRTTSMTCARCQAKFTRYDNYKRHLEQQHDRPVVYQCSACDMTTTRLDNFRVHVRRVHRAHARFGSEVTYTQVHTNRDDDVIVFP